MGENLSDFIYKVSVLFIFIAAVSVYMLLYGNASSLIEVVKENMYEDKALTQGSYENEEYTATGAEIISSIRSGLDVDIYVDGVKIEKVDREANSGLREDMVGNSTTVNANDTEDVYSKVIPDAMYAVSYNIDANGVITEVVYTKK